MNWTIEFYKTKNGKIPVKEFLDSLKPPNKELNIAKKE